MVPRIARLALASALIASTAADGRAGEDGERGSRSEVLPGANVPKRVVKSDAEWARLLTHDQFLVTRRKATEPAFSGRYVRNHARGTYACVCCDAPLFSSQTKFESGTGWPSFWRPVAADRVADVMDYSNGEARVEVTCRACGAHLGHVFDDGPPPTGLRYCMNSVALRFHPDPSAPAAPAAKKAKAVRGRAKARPKTSPSDSEAPAP